MEIASLIKPEIQPGQGLSISSPRLEIAGSGRGTLMHHDKQPMSRGCGDGSGLSSAKITAIP